MGKLKAASVSVCVNITLLLSKIFVAIITGSVGLLAESVHSSFDLIASMLAYAGIKKAEEPDDYTHLYGHEKYENLSSLLQAFIITGTSFIVMWEAYHKLKNYAAKLKSGQMNLKTAFTEFGLYLLFSSYILNKKK